MANGELLTQGTVLLRAVASVQKQYAMKVQPALSYQRPASAQPQPLRVYTPVNSLHSLPGSGHRVSESPPLLQPQCQRQSWHRWAGLHVDCHGLQQWRSPGPHCLGVGWWSWPEPAFWKEQTEVKANLRPVFVYSSLIFGDQLTHKQLHPA